MRIHYQQATTDSHINRDFFCQNYFSGIEKRRMQDDAGERVDVSLFKHTSLRNSLRLSSWLEMKFTLKYKTLDRLLSCVE